MKLGTSVVTGAAGFIGNAVARRLHRDGVEVVAIDDFSSGTHEEIAVGFPVIRCDARDERALNSVLPQKIDTIVHCAAQSSGEVSFDDPWDDMTRHVHATIRLLEIARARGVRHFIYTSSMAAYGQCQDLPVLESYPLVPLSFYGAGKAATENYVRIFTQGNMAFTILRPFSVYGPGQDFTNLRQGMISIYLAQLLQTGRVVVKGSLERFRDFVYIDDAVEAYIAVLNSSASFSQTFNLSSGTPTTVREVLDILLTEAGFGWEVIEEVPGTPGDQFGMFGDNRSIFQALDWVPTWSLARGIRSMREASNHNFSS